MINTSQENKESKYKWYILVLMALTGCFFVAMPQMCMPVLFKEISVDLDLSLQQIGVIWSMLPLAGLFTIFIGGLLADKFGARKVLYIGCFLTGISGILRGLSDSFTTLTAAMFLFGVLQILTSPAMIRACSTWFSGKHLGLANGVLSTSMGFGFLMGAMISATVLSPLLGGWRNVLIAYGVVSIVISILWFFSKSHPEHETPVASATESISLKDSILRVVKIKQLWILGIVMALQVGCVQGTLGYVPLYLQDSAGWDPAAADGALSVFHGLSTLFTVPIVLLSGRIASRKIILFFTTLLTAAGVAMMIFTTGTGVWVAMVIAGMVRDGFMATHMTMLLETEGVGTKYAGSAMGLAQTVARVGEIISPPIGNGMATINPQSPFILWSGMGFASFLAVFLIKGTKNKNRLPVPENQ